MAAYLATIRECREQLSKRADLRLYTTPIAMDDLEEARAALGYETLDGDACTMSVIQSLVISGSARTVDTACLAQTPPLRFRTR